MIFLGMTALWKIQTRLELLGSSNFPDPYLQAVKSTRVCQQTSFMEIQESSDVYSESSWLQ